MHLKYSVTGNEVEDEEFYGLDIMDKYDDEFNHNFNVLIPQENEQKVQNMGITMFVTPSTCVVNMNPGLWEIWRCI